MKGIGQKKSILLIVIPMFCLTPVDVHMYGGLGKIHCYCLKVNTKWVNLYPLLDVSFSHVESPSKTNTHCHKRCDWFTSRKHYGSTSTKTLRLANISVDTPADNNGNKDNETAHRQGQGRGLG
jgi:hypothetical protein